MTLRDEHREVLENQSNRPEIKEQRAEAWSEVARCYNASFLLKSGPRNPDQLRKAYNNLRLRHSMPVEVDQINNQTNGEDMQSEASEAVTFIAADILEEVHQEDGEQVTITSASRQSPRRRKKRMSAVLDIGAVMAQGAPLEEVSNKAEMARLEHRRKMQMMEEEHKAVMESHKMNTEKLSWEAKLARARYEREFGRAVMRMNEPSS